MTASKLNREWDPFTLAEGVANSNLGDKVEKLIQQYNRKIKVFHPDLVITGKVAARCATILKINAERRLRYIKIVGEKTWAKCPMVLGHVDLSRL